MHATRQRILEHLRRHRTATPAELSRSLQLSSADIRHHLAILRREGAIRLAGVQAPPGRGRPRQVFALAEAPPAEGMARLALALLHSLPEASRQETLENAARQIASLPGAPPAATHPTLRLNRAVRQLNALDYQARWEAHAAAPRLLLERCPYAAILDEYPDLCRMDAALIEALAGLPAEQVARLAPAAPGIRQCVFRLGRQIPGGSR
jgi:predicted ArsR family transcriptional regulator